jgi:THO complex subunit 2
MRERMELVIGAYDLDPNRVLDLVLDSLETNPLRTEVLDLVLKFSPTVATQLLGFKFLNAKVYRQGICLVAGWLIKRNIVKLHDLWAYLQPVDDHEVITSYRTHFQQALDLRRALTAVRLSSIDIVR